MLSRTPVIPTDEETGRSSEKEKTTPRHLYSFLTSVTSPPYSFTSVTVFARSRISRFALRTRCALKAPVVKVNT